MGLIVDPDDREAAVLRKLTAFDGRDVLDVGCGEGRTSRTMARTARSVVGVDPDEERIATAKAARREDGSCAIAYLADDIVSLERDAASFDTVVFTRSL